MIGWEPIQENIRLTRGDFIFARTRREGPLPAGTTAEIEWATATEEPTVWAATVAGDTISWRVESATADEIPHGTPFTIWIRYPNADTDTDDDYEWIVGHAQRRP